MKKVSLIELETKIGELISEREINFLPLGELFFKLKDNKLYKEKEGNFVRYCKSVWELSATYVNYVINAYLLTEQLRPHFPLEQLPPTEYCCRLLKKVAKADLPFLWAKVVNVSQETGTKINSNLVKEQISHRCTPQHTHVMPLPEKEKQVTSAPQKSEQPIVELELKKLLMVKDSLPPTKYKELVKGLEDYIDSFLDAYTKEQSSLS